RGTTGRIIASERPISPGEHRALLRPAGNVTPSNCGEEVLTMAWMEAGYEYGQEMRQWVSPSLIEANYILSLSQQELQTVIETEMSQNPALELDDRPTCPVCDSVLEGRFCPVCRSEQETPDNPDSLDSMNDF